MRVLCLYIEHFAAAVETKAHPELQGRPVVIGGLSHERKPVFDCSAEATCSGIRPGLPLREAHHLCPEAAFLPLDESRYTCAFDEVLAILDQFSPAVEPNGPGMAFMDVTGMGDLFGSEEMLASRVASEVLSRGGFYPKLGLANSKFVARVAAVLCSPGEVSIVAGGGERDFLKPVPAELLPLSEEMKRRLKLLGLQTMGQLFSLPADALASQFGQEGFLAYHLASGVDSRPVVPRPRPAILEDELCPDSQLESIEALAAAMGVILDRLLSKLGSQVCGKLELRFDMDGNGTWEESLMLKTPTRSKQRILRRIRHYLETLRFPGSISAIHLALADLGSEPADQGSLAGCRGNRQERNIEGAARKLKARFGKSPLKKITALDPCSRIPERRAALVDFPKAEE